MKSVYSAVRTGSLHETFTLFITETKSVYSAVRTGSLNENFTLFITETKSVYSAVRTGSLNDTFYAFYNRDEKCLQRGTELGLYMKLLRFL